MVDKQTDWEWIEKRGRERRARMRRKHRRDKLQAREMKIAQAKAMGQELPSDSEGSSSSLSSDFERKGVTVPKRYLEIDYGHGPDHPVTRGAAPGADEHGKIVRIAKKKWAKFGVERVKKSALTMKA